MKLNDILNNDKYFKVAVIAILIILFFRTCSTDNKQIVAIKSSQDSLATKIVYIKTAVADIRNDLVEYNKSVTSTIENGFLLSIMYKDKVDKKSMTIEGLRQRLKNSSK